ncbi:uncharacterized protein LOC141853825 [Brevipalpus obovatus]|uniref:uncharacterized protein LOC141853825 n=1 Tax=Brevipalpus obovatus TaxID=246614 RepID=UPI003D9F2098
MDTFGRLASKGTTLEEFAKDVYLKSNLTNRIRESIKQLKEEVYGEEEVGELTNGASVSGDDRNNPPKDLKIITEVSSVAVNDLVNCFEAIFLHALKGKPFINRVLLGKSNNNSTKHHQECRIDFWSVILILSHNQVSESLGQLNNIKTDVGRCRAWIRLTFNDGLLSSYLEALVNDTSLLHGFYRPSAYLRDKDQIEELKKLMEPLKTCTFQLNYDAHVLNDWSTDCLQLIGIIAQDTSPTVAAVDALSTIDDKKGRRDQLRRRNPNSRNSSVLSLKSDSYKNQSESSSSTHLSNDSLGANKLVSLEPCESSANGLVEEFSTKLKVSNSVSIPVPSFSTSSSKTGALKSNEINCIAEKPTSSPIDRDKNFKQLPNSFTTSDSIPFKRGNGPHRSRDVESENSPLEENTYESLLYSASTNVLLSSTPDIKEFVLPKPRAISSVPDEIDDFGDRVNDPPFKRNLGQSTEKASPINNDFEIIPKNLVLSNQEPETQEFLLQLTKIANQVGLDEQDYKCYACGRPVGMIYGKYKICEFDGFNYCNECHTDEKSLIPARIINNWDFKKYPVANRNKKRIHLVENEPLIDIKVSAPILYRAVKEMQDILDLRTQLFYLHAYLFTCKEQVALNLRRILWPKDHLYEHIHLYSTADLVQIQSNGNLAGTLKKAINFARKHVLSCVLCSQRGFICEICKSPQIIYPFDTDNTFRCESCKAVFHQSCYIMDESNKRPCPRCLRIKRRERAGLNF